MCSLGGIPGEDAQHPSPPPPQDNHRGDLLIPLHRGYSRSALPSRISTVFDSFIGDVALVHPRCGSSVDSSCWGAWSDRAVTDRIKLKSQHYSAYNDNAFAFLPMVVSTYQFMCDDLLRFLWFLAEAQARLAASNEALGDSEVSLTQLFASRMRSRVACAIAVGVARRIAAEHVLRVYVASDDPPLGPLGHSVDLPLFPFDR